ncbi:MAG: branched-chain amino acid ABC transporter permease [Flavobacteriaceae bacterium]
MDILISAIVVGTITGLLYALAGAGLVVIFRTSGYISFAQGDIAAVALYFGYWIYQLGAPYPVVAVAVVLAGAVLGGLIGTFLVVPMERFGLLTAALTTIAVGTTIQGIENVTVGATARAFPSFGDNVVFNIGPVGLTAQNTLAMVCSVAIFALLGLVFNKWRAGIAMRALSDSPEAAELLGVPTVLLRRLSWAIAGGLAGVAGLFVAPLFALTPSSVNSLLIFSFCAVVVGGFESIFGAMIAGVIVGIASNLTAAYLNPSLVPTVIFIILISVLLVRPAGLFGRRRIIRV